MPLQPAGSGMQHPTGGGSKGSAAPRDLPFRNCAYAGDPNFPDNTIRTTKYTRSTFVCVNLWEQLHKFGNSYFLLISCLMYLGEKTPLFVGTIKAFSTLGVLLMMMSLTALMAFLDDRRREAADRETNKQEVSTVVNGQEVKTHWCDVKVGDMMIVYKDKEIAADFVPLYCAGREGTCYVSTANLDGETNLKLKTAPEGAMKKVGKPGMEFKDVKDKIKQLSGSVKAEAPKTSIHDFNGQLILTGPDAAVDEPLGPKNLLLRGTVLRNTAWCFGVVVYTGAQTRMVMNSRKAPLKQSNLEAVTNRVMIIVLVAQAFLALLSDVLFSLNKDQYRSNWYLFPPNILLPDILGYFLTFFVLYSNLMPISLYPTMEFCNAVQSYFIKNDKRMFCLESKQGAGARSSNLCQELGQVKYIFSDKTGTLTQNVMELKRLSIGGISYGTVEPNQRGFNDKAGIRSASGDQEEAIRKFMQVLSVAHSVMATKGKTGQLEYEAESPDDLALVEAVKDIGFEFQGRVGDALTVQTPTRTENYKVIGVNEFDSDRKRMSAVVKLTVDGAEDASYFLMAKGADNVMLDRAKKDHGLRQLQDHLTEFSKNGLRTLVIGRRELTEEQVNEWKQKFDAAERQLEGRGQALARAAEKLEVDMEIVGATAIEDKLQVEVADTIKMIRDADIKLWVLTGDKLETAKNIGFSSGVLDDRMDIMELDTVAGGIKSEKLGEYRARAKKATDDGKKAAMLVTGAALQDVQESSEPLRTSFLDLATSLSIVIACRVSPLQKAYMVKMVREGKKPTPVTLAIGDGANDVPMIQEAQVGVGIAGKEGRQAVNNSDFSIAQFRFLQRLLFVHGRWNYRRVCKFTLFTFWRNAVQVLMIFYYTFASGYSGTSLFEDWIRLSFNVLCSFPIMATGCFDKDVEAEEALAKPHFYKIGSEGRDLNVKNMAFTLLSAWVHSLIIYVVTYVAFPSMDLSGVGDYYAFGTAVYTCLLVDVNYRVAFLNNTHNYYTVGSIIASCALYVFYLWFYPCQQWTTDLLAPNMYMVPYKLSTVPAFWVCLLLVPALAMTLDMSIHLYARSLSADKDKEREEIYAIRQASTGQKSDTRNREFKSPGLVPILQQDSSEENPDSTPDDGEFERAGLDLRPLVQQDSSFGRSRDFPRWFVSIFSLVMGVIIVLIGAWVLKSSMDTAQIRIHYAGERTFNMFGFADSDPLWTYEEEVLDLTSGDTGAETSSTGLKTHIVHIKKDMKQPILLYYNVGPFYQNYNDYLKSEVIGELRGEEASDDTRQKLCLEQTRKTDDGKDIIPCGMKATSVFNDIFEIENYKIDRSGIAWQSDLDRYHNPSGYGKTNVHKSWLSDRYPEIINVSKRDGGVRDVDFVSWMRPGALPRVWNDYGRIHQDLRAGETLKVSISSNHPVSPKGWKQLVLTTTDSFGGRHDAFGYVLILGGLLCCILAVVAHPLFCRAVARGSRAPASVQSGGA